MVASVVTAFSAPGAPLAHPLAFVHHAQNVVADALAGPQFSDVALSLEQYHTLSGTYDGAAVEGRGVTVRWATDRMYCVDGVTQGGTAEYLIGPHGRLAVGHCPYAAF